MHVLFVTTESSVADRWLAAAPGARAVRPQDLAEQLSSANAGSVCLVDLATSGLDGPRGVAGLARAYPEIRFFALAPVPNERDGVFLLRAGVQGYANRLIGPRLLTAAIEALGQGEVWAGKRLVQHLLQGARTTSAQEIASQSDGLADLTRRELQVAHMVAAGAGNKEIARSLGVTERTVKAHLNAIFRKTATKSRVQLALLVQGSSAESARQAAG